MLRVRGSLVVYMLVSIVLGWTVLTAVRVTLTTRYSLRRVSVEDGANKLLDAWSALEHNFARREERVRSHLQRDPLWPVTVARSERPSPPRPTAAAPVAKSRAAAVKSEAAAAAETSSPPMPRIVAVLFDREARALVHYDGANRLVRAGDRLGPLLVSRVSRDGVLIDWNGRSKLLRVRQ
jgi:hypothetical protein